MQFCNCLFHIETKRLSLFLPKDMKIDQLIHVHNDSVMAHTKDTISVPSDNLDMTQKLDKGCAVQPSRPVSPILPGRNMHNYNKLFATHYRPLDPAYFHQLKRGPFNRPLLEHQDSSEIRVARIHAASQKSNSLGKRSLVHVKSRRKQFANAGGSVRSRYENL